MKCSLCGIEEGDKIKNGGLCVTCGSFFCSNCYTIKEIKNIKHIYCLICDKSKKIKTPLIIYFYPIISYLFFFVLYSFVPDYVGKNLAIFFLLPLTSFLIIYYDYKIRKPFNPPLIIYLFLYILSLIPWSYSAFILMRLYR